MTVDPVWQVLAVVGILLRQLFFYRRVRLRRPITSQEVAGAFAEEGFEVTRPGAGGRVGHSPS